MTQVPGLGFGLGSPNIFQGGLTPLAFSPYGGQGSFAGPQILQTLQTIPQQLQQIQLLQQYQLAYLQQLINLLPTQQIQQPWQTFGMLPQPFAGQAPTHVM